MFTHNISPVLFEVGPLEVRYYGVLFAFGVLLAYLITMRLWKKAHFSMKHFDSLVIYLFVGMIAGARLGHIVFYNFNYYWQNPSQIIKIWEGGLASHGAAIGLFVAYLIFCWVKNVKFSKYVDIGVIAMPLVAGFVRVGNFFNSEIVGRETDLPWGVVFQQNGEDFARHPSQIYEALIAWAIFVVMIFMYRKKRRPYFFLFLFMGLYFASRILVEFVKEYPTYSGLTMGQWLSVLPMLIACGWFLYGLLRVRGGHRHESVK